MRALTILAVVVLSACSTANPTQSPAPKSVVVSASAAESTTQPTQTIAVEYPNTNDRAAEYSSIYFEFDSANVTPESRYALESAASIGGNITLEGNADERGSSEYNLALGVRRAESVRKALAAFGMSGLGISIVSNGSSKPRMTCHEEKCWRENRRVDFVK